MPTYGSKTVNRAISQGGTVTPSKTTPGYNTISIKNNVSGLTPPGVYIGSNGQKYHIPEPPSSSSSSSSNDYTPKQQIFKVVCTGMKPNAIHNFYYEGVNRGQDCIPVNPKPAGSSKVTPGDPLKTDATGRIEFNFYFTSSVEQQVDAANKVKYELPGNKKFELRTTNSEAFKIVPFIK
jgi:hypothetical protein